MCHRNLIYVWWMSGKREDEKEWEQEKKGKKKERHVREDRREERRPLTIQLTLLWLPEIHLRDWL